jgi:hypothetical protein
MSIKNSESSVCTVAGCAFRIPIIAYSIVRPYAIAVHFSCGMIENRSMAVRSKQIIFPCASNRRFLYCYFLNELN